MGGRTILLPGIAGFKRADGVVVNISYYVFPALAHFERLVPAPEWYRLRRDGLDLIDDARFGRWGLPHASGSHAAGGVWPFWADSA